MTKKLKLSLYRFDPAKDKRPYMSDYEIPYSSSGNMMVIDAIRKAHELDSTITFRRSCGQGVCGSDGVNMNGLNGLACITPVSKVATANRLAVRPLPGLPVIKDLIVDMKPFYDQYDCKAQKIEKNLMVFMSAYYVRVAQLAVLHSGGIQKNLLVRQHFYRHIVLLPIQEINKKE